MSDSPVPFLDLSLQIAPLRDEIIRGIADVCDAGHFVHGPACQRLEASIADYCDVSHAIGCASGSDALLLALMALDVGPGDEVLLPSFTFFATAGAIWRLGAKPVFVDIDPNTMNIQPSLIEAQITPATKAIVPVHLFGRCAAMDKIMALANEHDVYVVEDAAQAIGAEYGGRRAGSLGTVGCFSFYPSKNLGGFGDGGMLTTNDAALAERVRVLRDHGQSPQYHHSMVGLNSRLDTVQAAVLNVKFPYLDQWTFLRTKNAQRYTELFRSRSIRGNLVLPSTAVDQRLVWNQYTIRVPTTCRDALRTTLSKQDIATAVYYPVPLHQQSCFSSLGYAEGSFPKTERASGEVLSLPIYPELTEPQQQQVVEAITQFFESHNVEAA